MQSSKGEQESKDLMVEREYGSKDLSPQKQFQVLVTTPGKFKNRLRNDEMRNSISLIVVDEVHHLVNDPNIQFIIKTFETKDPSSRPKIIGDLLLFSDFLCNSDSLSRNDCLSVFESEDPRDGHFHYKPVQVVGLQNRDSQAL